MTGVMLPRGAWTPDHTAWLLTTLGEHRLRRALTQRLEHLDHDERELLHERLVWWRPGRTRRWQRRLTRIRGERVECLRRVALLETVLTAWRETTS